MANFSGLRDFFQANRDEQASIENRASGNLRTDVLRLGQERQEMAPQVGRHVGGVGNAASRLRGRLSRDATMRVAQGDQAAPVSFRGALNQATRRMRARQGIVNRGDAAISNQTLRDRIQVARVNATRRGSLQNALSQAANIREGVSVGVSNANQRIAQSQASMFGSIAGAATSYLAGRGDNGGGSVSEGVDTGTAAADAINANPGAGFNYSDPFAAPPVVYG